MLSLGNIGVRVVLAGVGPGVSYASLRPLVKNDADLLIVESFADLMKKSVELAKITCDAAGK